VGEAAGDRRLYPTSLSALSVERTLDFATELGLNTVEFGLGGWSSAPHVNTAELIGDPAARDRLQGQLRERNLERNAATTSS
jgi:hypothetical protein